MKRAVSVALVAGLFLCAPAQAAKMHFAHVTVGEKPVAWQSKQQFRKQRTVLVRFWSDGRELLHYDGRSRNGCVANFYGNGLAVRVTMCDRHRSAPLRVSAVSIAGEHRLRIAWRVLRD